MITERCNEIFSTSVMKSMWDIYFKKYINLQGLILINIEFCSGSVSLKFSDRLYKIPSFSEQCTG